MRRRFNFRLVALAFAVAAVAAPPAQANPPDLTGEEVRALQQAKAARVKVAKAIKTTQTRVVRRPIREYEPSERG